MYGTRETFQKVTVILQETVCIILPTNEYFWLVRCCFSVDTCLIMMAGGKYGEEDVYSQTVTLLPLIVLVMEWFAFWP